MWNDWPTILKLKMECESERYFLDLMMCTHLPSQQGGVLLEGTIAQSLP